MLTILLFWVKTLGRGFCRATSMKLVRAFSSNRSRDQAPASPGNALVLHFLRYMEMEPLITGIMYLSAMNIRILDNSSTVLASAQFNAPINSFFTSRKVVANLFAQLDQQNQHRVSRCKLEQKCLVFIQFQGREIEAVRDFGRPGRALARYPHFGPGLPIKQYQNVTVESPIPRVARSSRQAGGLSFSYVLVSCNTTT